MNAKAFRYVCVLLNLLIVGALAVPSPSWAEEGPGRGRCLPFQKDLTNPSLSDFLGQRTMIPISSQRSILRNSQKVSSQTFMVGGGHEKLMAVTVSCSARCDATGCSIQGCDASASGCSSCWCQGIGGCSSCSCTKTSTYTPD